MKTLIRSLALLTALPLLAFTGNKPAAPDLPKAFRDQFANVPSGMLATSDGEVKVNGFLIGTTEVSNAQYREFVQDVRASGDAGLLSAVLPDTSQWSRVLRYGEPLDQHYHSHPAYANYPVVNVGHAGALAYCAWLQNKLNGMPGTEGHYTVRLPERHEWWYAATAGHLHAQYAWGGPSLRNAKGCLLANFQQVGDENIHRDPETGEVEMVDRPAMVFGPIADNAFLTAPVDSYAPNDLGLYNMNGNVAELLADGTQAAGGSWRSPGHDVRNESVMPFTGPSPEVGFRVVVEVN